MECDKNLRPIADNTQCETFTLRVRQIVTGVVTEVTPRRDGWIIEGLSDLHGQWCQFFTTNSNAGAVKQGDRFELDWDAIKIFSSPVE